MSRISFAYPPGLFIEEEMVARGWSSSDVAVRMGGATVDEIGHDQLVVELIIAIRDGKENCLIGDDTARKLARAFDVSAEFFVNLEAQWRAHLKAERAPFPSPEGEHG